LIRPAACSSRQGRARSQIFHAHAGVGGQIETSSHQLETLPPLWAADAIVRDTRFRAIAPLRKLAHALLYLRAYGADNAPLGITSLPHLCVDPTDRGGGKTPGGHRRGRLTLFRRSPLIVCCR
jgi:hypothetical protein